MADTPPNGETAPIEPLENKAPTPSTPPIEEKKTEDSEVEKLRKEKEQIEMERNQLRKKLQAEEDAKAKAEQSKLEEKDEYKTLYEQERAKREEFEADRKAEEARRAVEHAENTVLSEFSDAVKELAEDTGLKLVDATDESVEAFREKLDKIQTRLGHAKITPNNPGTPSQKQEYTGQELREILMDPVKRDAYYRAKGGATADMMDPQR